MAPEIATFPPVGPAAVTRRLAHIRSKQRACPTALAATPCRGWPPFNTPSSPALMRSEHIDGPWRLYSHRQQRLADLEDLAPLPADLRTQSRYHPAGGEIWLRVRALHGETARLRRRERVLGSLPGKLHPDGGNRRGDVTDQALRVYSGIDTATGDRRPHGLHHRQRRARAVRHQHRLRLAGSRVQPDGIVARQRSLRQPI